MDQASTSHEGQSSVNLKPASGFAVPPSRKNERASDVMYVPTEEAYAHWASVYDTDGNFLQATDDLELDERLAPFLAMAKLRTDASVSVSDKSAAESRTIIDLGCGTGRNTFKISALASLEDVMVIGLDSSQEMLDIAREKASGTRYGSDTRMERLKFIRFDINDPASTFETDSSAPTTMRKHNLTYPHHPSIPKADAVISTLVIEHIEVEQFFDVVSELIKPDGYLLLTNMHSDMGKISQAGFVNSDGVKIRPKSVSHTISDVCTVAEKRGFEVLQVAEKEITEEDVPKLGVRSKKWVGIRCWFGITFKRHALVTGSSLM